jgi:hypothetical protein
LSPVSQVIDKVSINIVLEESEYILQVAVVPLLSNLKYVKGIVF